MPSSSPAAGPAAKGVPPAKLSKFDYGRVMAACLAYLVLRQRDHPFPPWAPLRVFDDGQKTYVQFPPKVAVTEAPPLFVLGHNGDAQLVNYRVKGDWYVVDRLFDRAELRLGEAPQTVVGIRSAGPWWPSPGVAWRSGSR